MGSQCQLRVHSFIEGVWGSLGRPKLLWDNVQASTRLSLKRQPKRDALKGLGLGVYRGPAPLRIPSVLGRKPVLRSKRLYQQEGTKVTHELESLLILSWGLLVPYATII